ncbi:Na+/H+ antiporter subunit A [Actinomadura rayongensis]|uniref:Na+/H+ antiporter subunit A n=1 Tax=Actinomadura rayongensis TaxID=1429076 RepID=A0A6I4W6Z3_9ACTN|nr:Na+/H+ antiporter subunit A [Actinomadura rayongensis]MXQ64025.1 Na+/H+ antiporter subunit A [Actinomadura rayongensis]
MLLLLAAHSLAALAAPALVRWWGRDAFLPLALVPAAMAAWAIPAWISGAAPREERHAWIPGLHLSLDFRADALSWMMVMIIGGVGALIVAYCARYFQTGEPGLGFFALHMLAFAASMIGLVLADNLILLYVFWELTTVFSYLLIGFDARKRAARGAATQALVITTFGGLAMLAGLVLLGNAAGTYRISDIMARPPGGGVMVAALSLVLAGALSKSAIIPFGLWLPGAMAAPTPVSAFLHAAAMVKAGVYLGVRLGPAFVHTITWGPIVVSLGAATMVFAGWRAMRETDVKLLLAYGTVSQLGFMITLAAAGTRTAALASMTVLLAHALFKAALFLIVGIIDHATGTRDLRELSGLRHSTPVLAGAATVAVASMAGIPATLGFVGKEAGYEAFAREDHVLLVVLVAGSAFTAAYGLRFLWGAFARKDGVPDTPVHRPTPGLLAPPVLLAVAGVVLGLAANVLDAPLEREVAGYPGPHTYHLAPWHGFGLPLWLTAGSLALGGLLFLAREPLARTHRRLVVFEPAAVYRAIMDRTNDTAMQITGSVQRGSLPGYLLVIALTAAVAMISAAAAARPWTQHGGWRLWNGPFQGTVSLMIMLAAVGVVRARNRGATVVLVGATGYGAATQFFLHAAPDLALTQFLVETASLIVFVLVLRSMPMGFPATRPASRRAVHVVVAVLVGASVTAAVLIAGHARTAAPISGAYPAAAAEAGSKNVVSAVIVDIRAWDTLGETCVIALAALGITSIVFARRRAGYRPRPPEGRGADVWAVEGFESVDQPEPGTPRRGQRDWLQGGGTLAAERRSLIFEVVARFIFHTVLLMSLYLLFAAHSSPGGGFAGGIVAGLAVVVRYLAGGPYELAAAAPMSVGTVLGTGLICTTGTAFAGFAWGGAVLKSALVDVTLPVFGHLEISTSLLFDAGVYLIVVGLVLDVLITLGAEADREAEAPGAVVS